MTCPICAKETAPEYRPFCSKRCADVDLGKWLNGSYRVAAEDPDDLEDLVEEMERELAERPLKPH